MTNNYYDGGGNRVNRDRYQNLITEYLHQRRGPAPFVENRQTGRRLYARLPLIRRRRGGQSIRVQSYRCSLHPRSSSTATKPKIGRRNKYVEKIKESNTKHAVHQLKKDLEDEVSMTELQQQLDAMSTPDPIEHHYNKSNEWLYTEGNSTSLDHSFRNLTKTKVERLDAISKDYLRGASASGITLDKVKYKRRMKEVHYFLKLLPLLPFRRYTNICLEELASQTQPAFNKQAKHYSGSELDDYVASQIVPTTTKHVAVDKNNLVLYLYLPDAIQDYHRERMSLATLNLLLEFPKQYPKAKDRRHYGAKDVSVYHLLEWCPIGHREQKCVSRQSIANGKTLAMDSIIGTTESMENVREKASVLMALIDPIMYEAYTAATTTATKAYNRLLRACEHDVYLGCVINTGRVRNHRDWSDVFCGLSTMTPLGHYVGGDLVFPQLGVRLVYPPGTLVMCSMQAIEHYITAWFGIRVGTVHCSHDDRVSYLYEDEPIENDDSFILEPPRKKQKQ